MDWHLFFHDLANFALAACALVAFYFVYACDNNLIVFRKSLDDFPLFARIFAGENFYFVSFLYVHGIDLNDFSGAGSDSLKALLGDFARNWTENASGERFLLSLFKNDDRILVETDV